MTSGEPNLVHVIYMYTTSSIVHSSTTFSWKLSIMYSNFNVMSMNYHSSGLYVVTYRISESFVAISC